MAAADVRWSPSVECGWEPPATSRCPGLRTTGWSCAASEPSATSILTPSQTCTQKPLLQRWGKFPHRGFLSRTSHGRRKADIPASWTFPSDERQRRPVRPRPADTDALLRCWRRRCPTRLRVGSHREAARILAPCGEDGLSTMEVSAQAAAATEGCPVVLATGRAGRLPVPSVHGSRSTAAIHDSSPNRHCTHAGGSIRLSMSRWQCSRAAGGPSPVLRIGSDTGRALPSRRPRMRRCPWRSRATFMFIGSGRRPQETRGRRTCQRRRSHAGSPWLSLR